MRSVTLKGHSGNDPRIQSRVHDYHLSLNKDLLQNEIEHLVEFNDVSTDKFMIIFSAKLWITERFNLPDVN